MSVNRYLRNRAGSALQRNDARLARTCVPIHSLVVPVQYTETRRVDETHVALKQYVAMVKGNRAATPDFNGPD